MRFQFVRAPLLFAVSGKIGSAKMNAPGGGGGLRYSYLKRGGGGAFFAAGERHCQKHSKSSFGRRLLVNHFSIEANLATAAAGFCRKERSSFEM